MYRKLKVSDEDMREAKRVHIFHTMQNILSQNIINDLGLNTLTAEEQEEVLMTIGRIIFQAIMIRVMQEINDEDKPQLEKIMEENPDNPDAVYNFLKGKIPHLDQIANEEVAKFKEESIDFMKKVRST